MPEQPAGTAARIASAEEIRKNRHIIAAASSDLSTLRLTKEERAIAGGALSSKHLQASQAAVRLLTLRPDIGQAAGVDLPAIGQALDADVALVQLQAAAAAAARTAEDGVILLDVALTEQGDAVLEHVDRRTSDESAPAEARRNLRTAFTAADLVYDTAQSESRSRRELRASRRSAHERRLDEARRDSDASPIDEDEHEQERLPGGAPRRKGGRA